MSVLIWLPDLIKAIGGKFERFRRRRRNLLQTRRRQDARRWEMMHGVTGVALLFTLEQNEPVRLDPDRLDNLYRQLGTGAAENVICRAIEELALRLTRCELHWRRQNWEALYKGARSLVGIADQVGMTALVRVAGDVAGAAESGDPAAIGATLFRLIRVGEKSLVAVWDAQDLSV